MILTTFLQVFNYFLKTQKNINSVSRKQVLMLPRPSLHTIHVTLGKLLSFSGCAAAAAKSLQSCPALCNPIDGSLPGSPVPEILQARTLERVAIFFSNIAKREFWILTNNHFGLLAQTR